MWSAGNDRLWDTLGETSGGALDFLKVVSSHPSQSYSRDTRWEYFGLVNEPCFAKPTAASPVRRNLWVDQRQADGVADQAGIGKNPWNAVVQVTAIRQAGQAIRAGDQHQPLHPEHD